MQQDVLLAFEEFLHERMKERGMTVHKLAELSGISQKHLEYLTRGEFERLPAAPYIRGYLQKIAPHLEFNAEEWWGELRKSPEIKSSGERDALPENRFAKREFKTYLWIGGFALVVILFVILRLANILGRPSIRIASPAESFITTSDDHFLMVGVAANATELTINSESVVLGKDGNFQKDVSLEPGLNTITFVGKKFLGGETTVSRQIFSEGKPVTTTSTPANSPTSTTATSTPN